MPLKPKTHTLPPLNNAKEEYCCQEKQYYCSDVSSLVESLHIKPRVIIYRNKLHVNKQYEAVINIINKSLHKRYLSYISNCKDISLQIQPSKFMDNFLPPNSSVQIVVIINPIGKKDINDLRHVFIKAEHPNITFEIPIIIIGEQQETILNSAIQFPRTCPNNSTFYEMLIYNNSLEKLPFSIKNKNPQLTIYNSNLAIAKQDYVKVLLKLKCTNLCPVRNVLKFKYGTGTFFDIPCSHEPLERYLFVDHKFLNFNAIKFYEESELPLRICNDCRETLDFQIQFETGNEAAQLIEPIACKDRLFPAAASSATVMPDKNWSDEHAYRHFNYTVIGQCVLPNSSTKVSLRFQPKMHKDFNAPAEKQPPFIVQSKLHVISQNETSVLRKEVTMQGIINGPEINLFPKVLDLKEIYYGEEHCRRIQVTNIEAVSKTHVYFNRLVTNDNIQAIVTPKEGFLLLPGQTAFFTTRLYSLTMGHFFARLEFKVKNGACFTSVVKGSVQVVRPKYYPEILELGRIPVAIPQKRLVLLMNHMSVPITISCTLENNGAENPLILNVQNCEEFLPITITDPVALMMKCREDENENECSFEDQEFQIEFGSESNPSLITFHSMLSEMEDGTSSYSTDFEKNVMENIPDLAANLVNVLKKIKVFCKPEKEKNVFDETLKALVQNTSYFAALDEHKNYTEIDWNLMASDPKELYVSQEVIHLLPNTGKSIYIMLIPNIIGSHQKYVTLRTCPITSQTANTAELQINTNPANWQQIVEPENVMISKIFIEYTCAVPEIIWDSTIRMKQDIYAGEIYNVIMNFENDSDIGGFLHYDVVPDCELGVLTFPNNKWKYFIEPSTCMDVKCTVKYRSCGDIQLSGIIKFLGIDTGYPFHIYSHVLPPNVTCSPNVVVKKFKVQEKITEYFYIHNATPTTTWLAFKLKDEHNAGIDYYGAQLSPLGQGICLTMECFYKDPGFFRNILEIQLEYCNIKHIPITHRVEGMPIYFVPEIENEYINLNNILCLSEEEFNKDIPCHVMAIQILNKGERDYRLVINRTKTSKKTCTLSSTKQKAKLCVKPKNLIIKPGLQNWIVIMAYACEECEIHNEFRYEIIDTTELTRKETKRVVIEAQFCLPKLMWNRKEITMSYERKHLYQEHDQWELVKLSNTLNIAIDWVRLSVMGPFKIKQHFEDQYVKDLVFSMLPLETKEFFILMDKIAIRESCNICSIQMGKLQCVANGMSQQTVYLKIIMFIPEIILKHSEVVLFCKYNEGVTFIPLHNVGPKMAQYKWRKLQETCHYVKEEDNSKQVADILLCDIVDNLSLGSINIEDDPEINLSKRYQKYKCFLTEPDDPLNIRDIINEIVQNLDLMHKRYQLDYKDPLSEVSRIVDDIQTKENREGETDYDVVEDGENLTTAEANVDNSKALYNEEDETVQSKSESVRSESSDSTCVYYTLDHVCKHLKLDDSFTISAASTDTCEQLNSVYFYAKCGTLETKEQIRSTLHLPPVRNGFEVSALFELDVIGGIAKYFRITLVNLDKTLNVSRDNIYLGVKPWYEVNTSSVQLENITNYPITLEIQSLVQTVEDTPSKYSLGYIKILAKRILSLNAKQTQVLKIQEIMGFNEEFQHNIQLTINDGELKNICLHGHGAMSMLTMLNRKIPYAMLTQDEIVQEYCILQKIYYYEVFKSIIEIEDLCELGGIEETDANGSSGSSVTENIDILSLVSTEYCETESCYNKNEFIFNKLLNSFILVENCEELPNVMILMQLMETERFRRQLAMNTKDCNILNTLHQIHLEEPKNFTENISRNLKNFIVQPLPFLQRGFECDMGKLYLNEYRKIILCFELTGPGRCIVSARTEIKIPGLLVDFELVDDNPETKSVYYRADEGPPNVCEKVYRNIHERLLDMQADPKLKHAHSFDITSDHHHVRSEKTSKERKYIASLYNSLKKSIYEERNYHWLHCKIFKENVYSNISDTKLNITLLLKPGNHCYRVGQTLEDYLYVDIHLGATLPILLKGNIVMRDYSPKKNIKN